MSVQDAIRKYSPYNKQEAADQSLILSFLEHNPDAFLRSNLIAHMTASSWIVNQQRSKILMVYHKIYDSWSWTGGHADGDMNLASVALREAHEETGVQSIRLLSEDIFSLESLPVNGHEKNGIYVPSHLHLNVTYLLEAYDSDPLRICSSENSDVRWFALADAPEASSEPWFVQRVYRKLNEKLLVSLN